MGDKCSLKVGAWSTASWHSCKSLSCRRGATCILHDMHDDHVCALVRGATACAAALQMCTAMVSCCGRFAHGATSACA